MKRLIDFLISTFALLLLSLPLFALAWLIRLKLGSPIFFYARAPWALR